MKRCIWVTGSVRAAAALALCLAAPVVASISAAREEVPPKPPLGLPEVIWPRDNPYSRAKVELGRLLFFDKRLSADRTVSCASCHAPEHAFTDGQPVATGIKEQKGNRSAPTVINRAYSVEQFWDGRAPTLEEQAKGPLANPLEMTSHSKADAAHAACVDCLMGIPGYRRLFSQVFHTDRITIDHVARAIATFERTILSGNSPYDRYKAGDQNALSPAQARGFRIFFYKTACDSCHFGANFTDGQFVNVGIGMDKPNPDLGRYLVSHREEDKGAFKTPTLREVAHTAPYFHDGRAKTLAEVVEHYDKGGIKNPYLDQRIKPLHLTSQEKSDLVEFLKSLSGEGWQQVREPQRFPD